jgi:hypothetical protein
MCCIVEIVLFILGILGLTTGQLPLTRTRVIYGIPAHFFGLLMMLPLVLGLGGLGYALHTASKQNVDLMDTDVFKVLRIVEPATVLAAAILLYTVGWLLADNIAGQGYGWRQGGGLAVGGGSTVAVVFIGCGCTCLVGGTLGAVVAIQKLGDVGPGPVAGGPMPTSPPGGAGNPGNQPSGPGDPKIDDNLPGPAVGQSIQVRRVKVKGYDVTGLNLPVRQGNVVTDLVWTAQGDAFFVLTDDGNLSRVALNGLILEKRVSLGQKCSCLALSGQGLVVTLPDSKTVLVLDPVTLATKKQITIKTNGGVHRAVAAPVLNLAFAVGPFSVGDNNLYVLDLVKGTTLR